MFLLRFEPNLASLGSLSGQTSFDDFWPKGPGLYQSSDELRFTNSLVFYHKDGYQTYETANHKHGGTINA